MGARGRGWMAAPIMAAALAMAAPGVTRAAFLPGMEWGAGVGRTTAVTNFASRAGVRRESGGWAFQFTGMRPFRNRWHGGLTVFAADYGQRLRWLVDPNDGMVLGLTQDLHRSSWGLAARLDADLWSWKAVPGLRIPASAGFASGTIGRWRTRDDRLGQELGSETAFGWSLGGGQRFHMPGRVSLGPAVRYHRVFGDRMGRYVTLSVDASWR